MLLAPHPDDETIGAGGWLYAARTRGAEVRIVFLTNGDAFHLAALSALRRLPSPATRRALGDHRRSEAIRAAAALNVAPDALTFLGYPDRGLDRLGRANSHSPGRTSRRESLMEDLISVLLDYRPQYLIAPDEGDDHEDHRAAAAYAREAVAALPRTVRPPWIRGYVVHCGLWPTPHRIAPSSRLTPPKRLLRLRQWESFPLDNAALRAKALALKQHRSQHLWAASLLGAHCRANELFARHSQARNPEQR